MFTLYGAPGAGSAIVEIMFALAGEPYQWVNVDGYDRPGAARDSLAALNPLCQVPTLVLDDGGIMTESAAIALLLLDSHPHLAPAAGTADRRQFYRLLVWLVANVYPTFTYGDYPERWAPGQPGELVASTDRYRERLYLWLETQLGAGPYLFGDVVTLIDAYWPVLVHWGPRKPWFKQHAPRLFAMAEHVGRLPELQPILKANTLV
ncbi:glutathione S-transferase family protein [Sodalis sp. RH24]|uniref:glutathione S-transferase family protein n=1 Tax=unclassified Sodalis (in: enterobacteria) TaxID=2636512 RepID=UPI0039B4AD7C